MDITRNTIETYLRAIDPLVEKANGNVEMALAHVKGGVKMVKADDETLKSLLFLKTYTYDGYDVLLFVEMKPNPRLAGIKRRHIRDMNE